ncbi:MAG: polysaccharide export protein [Candidatus Competibacteraceae bacterium]|nr:polysaccharide export protein [Candidatus Competibacteraceae bacterium]
MGVMAIVLMLGACAKQPGLPPSTQYGSQTSSPETYNYLIGPGDQLQIFVWRNPEVSQTVTVRPDGKISTPLVEDLQASGKTSAQLAKDLEKALETYIRQPIVTVIVVAGIGPYSEQIRVIGQVGSLRNGQTTGSQGGQAGVQAIAYRRKMTLLDVMVTVGGLNEFAAGNKTKLVRMVDGEQREYEVRLDDLLNGDISANVDMLPGDILIIPESWF